MGSSFGIVLNSFNQLPGMAFLDTYVWNAPLRSRASDWHDRDYVDEDLVHKHYFPDGYSSWIRAVEWDENSGDLELFLLSGKSYTYPNTPKPVYDAFVSASSPGSVFWRYLSGNTFGRI